MIGYHTMLASHLQSERLANIIVKTGRQSNTAPSQYSGTFDL
jgi:hypothetical protein